MAAYTFVMVVDGVLRKPSTNAVIEQGLALYHTLSGAGRLALLCGPDKDKVDWFLRTNGLTHHTSLIEEDKFSSSKVQSRLQQIRAVRRDGANVAFVIEPDPQIALELFKESIPTMVYLHPVFTQPAFRPGYKSTAKPWDDLISEVEYQIETKAAHAYDHQEVSE